MVNRERWLGIRGMLCDLNGVFYIGEQPLPGAREAITALRQWGMPYRFLTNNTTLSLGSLARQLQAMGLAIRTAEILSVPAAAVLYLRQMGSPTCELVLQEDVRQDFAEFRTADQPEVAVIGDIGTSWNYAILNRLFRQVMGGTQLLALHKGRYWQVEDGLSLDIGAFVAALEYATGQTATVIGKPSLGFYQLALDALELRPDQVLMVGDDLEADIGGAQALGMRGILVRTGKFRPQQLAQSQVQPDAVLDSIADLPTFLDTVIQP